MKEKYSVYTLNIYCRVALFCTPLNKSAARAKLKSFSSDMPTPLSIVERVSSNTVLAP